MDAALIDALRNNDQQAFRIIYETFHARLYHYALKKSRSSSIAEEVVQLTFIKCWRYRNSLNSDINLSRQLFRIARTTLIDVLRQQAQARIVPLCVAHEDICLHHEAQSLYDDEVQVLSASLEFLPVKRREIVAFRLQGMSNSEIATTLSISKKTVENQLNQAIKEIKKQVAEPAVSSVFLLCLGQLGN